MLSRQPRGPLGSDGEKSRRAMTRATGVASLHRTTAAALSFCSYPSLSPHLLLVDSPDTVGEAVVPPLWRDVSVNPLDLEEKLRPAGGRSVAAYFKMRLSGGSTPRDGGVRGVDCTGQVGEKKEPSRVWVRTHFLLLLW